MARLLLGIVGAAAALAAASPAHAGPGTGPTAAVSLGDSYISGQAGRWQGNSLNPVPPHDGTDRGRDAYVGGSDQNNCHRSDVAEILSATLSVTERINLACSGAQTEDIFRASRGGVGEKGEAPQADALLPLAKAKDVRMVVLSIGGNDLGFASVVVACVQAYVTKTTPCRETQAAGIEAKVPAATAGVMKSIDEIRAVMAEAGYQPAQYRLVLQTYPSVIPRAGEARYSEASEERGPNGCPFYDVDLDWARDVVAPRIGEMVKAAAKARDAEVVELIDALKGHEVCSKDAAQATPFAIPERGRSEWGRFTTISTIQQGELEEAFHPSAYGQLALGSCLSQVYTAGSPGTFTCAGAAGRDVDGMVLRRTSTLSHERVQASAPRLRLSVRRAAGCLVFRVSARGVPVRGATVRVAGRRLRTDSRGTARSCRRLARRSYRVTASRTGYRPATRTVRGRART